MLKRSREKIAFARRAGSRAGEGSVAHAQTPDSDRVSKPLPRPWRSARVSGCGFRTVMAHDRPVPPSFTTPGGIFPLPASDEFIQIQQNAADTHPYGCLGRVQTLYTLGRKQTGSELRFSCEELLLLFVELKQAISLIGLWPTSNAELEHVVKAVSWGFPDSPAESASPVPAPPGRIRGRSANSAPAAGLLSALAGCKPATNWVHQSS